jgi:hypothetical protein
LLFFGDLAGDVGDDGPVSVQLAGVRRQSAEGVEVGVDMGPADIGVGGRGLGGIAAAPVLAVEEVEVDVGAELIHGARFVLGFETAGEVVDAARDAVDPVRGQVQSEQVGGAVAAGFGDETTGLDRRLVAFLGSVGVGLDDDPVEAGAELTSGQPTGGLDEMCDYLTGPRNGEMQRAVGQDSSPAGVDPSPSQRLPHCGEASLQFQGETQLTVCGRPGEAQRHPDLSRRCLCGPLFLVGIVFHGINHRRHRLIDLGLEV